MSRKGFTPKGPYVGGSDGFGARTTKTASHVDLATAARDVDELRREDSLEVQRELQAIGSEVDDVRRAVETSRCVAFGRLSLSGGVVVDAQAKNLTVSSVTVSALTLQMANAPSSYAVTATMGAQSETVVYKVTARESAFDVEQRDLADVAVDWTVGDFEIHIAVNGSLFQ